MNIQQIRRKYFIYIKKKFRKSFFIYKCVRIFTKKKIWDPPMCIFPRVDFFIINKKKHTEKKIRMIRYFFLDEKATIVDFRKICMCQLDPISLDLTRPAPQPY